MHSILPSFTLRQEQIKCQVHVFYGLQAITRCCTIYGQGWLKSRHFSMNHRSPFRTTLFNLLKSQYIFSGRSCLFWQEYCFRYYYHVPPRDGTRKNPLFISLEQAPCACSSQFPRFYRGLIAALGAANPGRIKSATLRCQEQSSLCCNRPAVWAQTLDREVKPHLFVPYRTITGFTLRKGYLCGEIK